MYSFEDFYTAGSDLATQMGHSFLTSDHLAIVALELDSIRDFLSEVNIDADQLRSRCIELVESVEPPKTPEPVESMIQEGLSPVSSLVSHIMYELQKKTVIEQLKENDYTIPSYFIFFEVLSFPRTALETALEELDVNRTVLARELQNYITEQKHDFNLHESTTAPSESTQRKYASESKSQQRSLESYTTDLTELAREGKLSPTIGRSTEVEDLIQALQRKTKKNAALVGEPGVGKTQIVDGLAQRIVDGDVPEDMLNTTILSLNIGALTAGTKFRGEFEERVDNLINELKKRPDVVLFIDELHGMMGAGSTGGGTMDLCNMLKPSLSRGEIRVIGATTYDEYRKHIEKDSALQRRFMKIDVVEPSVQDTRKIIEGVKGTFEEYHKVQFSTESLDAVMELSVSTYRTNVSLIKQLI